jgi:hypothetical protein
VHSAAAAAAAQPATDRLATFLSDDLHRRQQQQQQQQYQQQRRQQQQPAKFSDGHPKRSQYGQSNSCPSNDTAALRTAESLRRLEQQQQLRMLAEAQVQISRSAPVSPVSHSRYGSSTTGYRGQNAVHGVRAGAVSALSSYEHSHEAVTRCGDSDAGGLSVSPIRAATAAASRLSFGTAMFDDLADSRDSSGGAEMHLKRGPNNLSQQSAYMDYLRGYRASASSRQNQAPAESSGGKSSASERSRAAYQAAFGELQRLRKLAEADALTSPRARAEELLANDERSNSSSASAMRACIEPRRRSASALTYHSQLLTQRSGVNNVEGSNSILKKGSRSTNCSPDRHRGQDLLASVFSNSSSSAYERSTAGTGTPDMNRQRPLARACTADIKGEGTDGFIEPNSPLARPENSFAAAGAVAGCSSSALGAAATAFRCSWDGSSGGTRQSAPQTLKVHRASTLGRRSYSPARRLRRVQPYSGL